MSDADDQWTYVDQTIGGRRCDTRTGNTQRLTTVSWEIQCSYVVVSVLCWKLASDFAATLLYSLHGIPPSDFTGGASTTITSHW